MNYVNDDYFLGHLQKQIRNTNECKLKIDILKNNAEPKILLTKEVKTSIENWTKWFPSLVEKGGSTMEFISSAIMTIEFDLEKSRPYLGNQDYMENPFICEIIIIDDRGKTYKQRQEGWWFPETK